MDKEKLEALKSKAAVYGDWQKLRNSGEKVTLKEYQQLVRG